MEGTFILTVILFLYDRVCLLFYVSHDNLTDCLVAEHAFQHRSNQVHPSGVTERVCLSLRRSHCVCSSID